MDAFELKKEADAAVRSGAHKKSIDLYRKALEVRPQFAGCYYSLGLVQVEQGDYLNAAINFWNSYLFHEFRKEPLLMAARALQLSSGRSFQASTLFEMLPLSDLDPLSKVFYADALCVQNRYYEAQELVADFPEEPRDFVDLVRGIIEIGIGDPGRAEEYLRPLVTRSGTAVAGDNMIYALFSQGKIEDAFKCIDITKEARGIVYPDFYPCLKAGVNLLLNNIEPPKNLNPNTPKYQIVRSAAYLSGKADDKFVHTGRSFQTLDVASEVANSDGLVLEFGVRFGHTITRIAQNFADRTIYGFDSFQGLPEKWHKEGAGSYSTRGRIPHVPPNVEFVVGWFNETLPRFVTRHPEPVAFMNVDCDLYSSTKTIFEFLDRQIVEGTVIVFDEYICNEHWEEDEFKAFQEWVAASEASYEYVAGSLLTKQVAVRILSRS